MDSGTVHRELLLPSPTKDPPDILPLVWASPTPFWLEIHRETVGRVRYSLGSNSASDLEAMLAYLESMRPRLTGGAPIECSAATLVPEGVFARAVPVQQHHHLPIRIQPKVDSASFLLRTLGSRALRDHDVLLQLLFRRLRGWESTLLSPLYDKSLSASTTRSGSRCTRGGLRRPIMSSSGPTSQGLSQRKH